MFDKLKNIFEQKLAGFAIKFKDQSLFMKIIGALMFYNSTFMTRYTTTIGKTVYFPSEEKLDKSSYNSLIVLSHEFRHACDYNKNKFWFFFSYLFPQILALIFLIMTIAAIWINWSLFFVMLGLFLIFAAPIPAYWRKKWELRGYITNLFVINEIHKNRWGDSNLLARMEIINLLIGDYDNIFKSSAYYFMWPFGVKEELSQAFEDIFSGKIVQDNLFYAELQQSLSKCIT